MSIKELISDSLAGRRNRDIGESELVVVFMVERLKLTLGGLYKALDNYDKKDN